MASLDNYVTLTITRDSVGVARAGFGVPLILSHTAGFSERVRYYTQLSDLVDDGFAEDEPEYLAAAAILSQDPHPTRLAIGRGANAPTQVYTLDVTTTAANQEYVLTVGGVGFDETEVSYTSGSINQAITSVTNGSDLFTKVGHTLTTGIPARLTNSGGALPTGVAVDTTYFVIRIDDDTFKLAATAADALAGTPINLTSDGTGTHTINTYTHDLAIERLVTGLNAVASNNYIAAVVPGAAETDTMTVTADAAGGWFSLEVEDADVLRIAQTHADPGVSADLTAIARSQPDWYCLLTLYNSDLYVKAAAAWVEANSRIYVADQNHTRAITDTVGTAGANDTVDALHTLNYGRTMTAYHPRPSAMFAAGWAGARLFYDAGAETWKFANISGVEAVVLTPTQRTNLAAKKGNSYETVAGIDITFEGWTADGEFLDVRRGLDWLTDDMKKSVFEVLAAGPKVPYTNKGIARVEAAMRGSLKRAVAQGVLSDDVTPTVTVPKVANISTANKTARLLPDLKFTGTLAGAIHAADIRGTVSA